MPFRLVVEKDGKPVRVVEVQTAVARIGRAHGNEVRIPSAEVSRRHCHLQMQDGLLKVEDLESVNGTYLNGDLVTGESVVRPGDRLEVGPVMFVVEYELTPNALDRLRDMDYEVVSGESVETEPPLDVLEAEDVDEEPAPRSKKETRRRLRDTAPEDEALPLVGDDAVELPAEGEEVIDVPEIEEVENYTPRADLDEMKLQPSQEGDMRDLLSHLDEGQESLLPRKRPGPRPRPAKKDEWPDERRGDDDQSPKPKNKGGKRRPKGEE